MLILSGGGDPEKVVPIDIFFSEQIDKDRTVLYIPLAMEERCFTYKECYNWFKNTYGQYGVSNIKMCIDLKEEPSDLSEYAAVFIGGGNTFKLLKMIKESNFDQKLIRYLLDGGIIYGGSAGAIIFGKTIRTALYADENYVGLTDLNGLNVLENKDIWCHYSEKDDKLICNYDNELYLLYEASGLVLDDKKIIGIGKSYKIKH